MKPKYKRIYLKDYLATFLQLGKICLCPLTAFVFSVDDQLQVVTNLTRRTWAGETVKNLNQMHFLAGGNLSPNKSCSTWIDYRLHITDYLPPINLKLIPNWQQTDCIISARCTDVALKRVIDCEWLQISSWSWKQQFQSQQNCNKKFLHRVLIILVMMHCPTIVYMQ